MEDILNALVNTMNTIANGQEQQRLAIEEQRKENAELMKRLLDQQATGSRSTPPPPAEDAAAPGRTVSRLEQMAMLDAQMRKTTKVRDYKRGSPESINDWISRFDGELICMAKGPCKINVATDALTDMEYVQILCGKLDHDVKKDIEKLFADQSPAII